MAKCKYMNKRDKEFYKLDSFPNCGPYPNIKGIKEKYYGRDALLVRSGAYVYHVPKYIYDAAH